MKRMERSLLLMMISFKFLFWLYRCYFPLKLFTVLYPELIIADLDLKVYVIITGPD